MSHNWKWLFLITLFIGGYLSMFASSSPDGLMRVVEDQGFAGNSMQYFRGLMPTYHMPGIESPHLSTSLSGLAGVVTVFVLLFGASRYLFPSVSVGKEESLSIHETFHK